ncbi:MobQ family relaxase, partial [Priestia megaterium]|uniref:MobQ family relaxase n=1 Tax=Priestia megaterium TaxID=1404 RepID=UPI003F7E753F
KGKKTDRGQINRERQDYNKAVVDLQAYRHQKEEHLKKMKEKETQFSFSTDIEKTYIQKAASLVGQKVITLEDITARHEELRKMSDRHDPIERHFHIQQQQFLNVSNYYDRVGDLEREIQQNEEKVEELKKSLNPFKLKENNMMKRRYLDKISDLESNKESYKSSIQKYKESLRFSNKEEFYQRYQEFSEKKENRLNQIKYEKKQIQVETRVLLQAEEAIKQAKIREISSYYPDLKTAGKYLTYSSALRLEQYHDTAQQNQFRLSNIKQSLDTCQKKLDEFKKHQKMVRIEKEHVSTMSKEVEKLNSVKKKLDELDRSPGEKAKRLVSKKARQDYEELQSEAKYGHENLKELGYKGQQDLQQQQGRMNTMEKTVVPWLEKEIKTHEGNKNVLNNVFNAIQQATRSQEQAQQRHQLREMRSTTINRAKNKGPDLNR